MQLLFSEHIKVHASFGVLDDAIAKALETDDDLIGALEQKETVLRALFKKFSVGEEDKRNMDATTAGTMNMAEFINMLNVANLIDNKLTQREARVAIGETVILLPPPPLSLVGVSIAIGRGISKMTVSPMARSEASSSRSCAEPTLCLTSVCSHRPAVFAAELERQPVFNKSISATSL